MENKYLKNFKENFYLESGMVKMSLLFSHLTLLFVSFQYSRTSIVRWSKPGWRMACKFLACIEIISIKWFFDIYFLNCKMVFLKILYLFIHETHTHRGRDTGRGRSRLHAGSPMWDSIPGPQDHALSPVSYTHLTLPTMW